MRPSVTLCIILLTAVFSADAAASAADSVATKPKNLYERVLDYFNHTNDVKPHKDLDFSFIGGPYYSSDSKLGLGLMAAGIYRHDKNDTDIQPSNVTIYFDITSRLCAQLGVRGIHIFPRDSRRLTYDVNFANINTKFWGIGYDNAINDDNESKYKYLNSHAQAEFVWRITGKFYGGPMMTFDYINGRDFKKPQLWDGQPDRTFSAGVGFTLQYDTRDNSTYTTDGLYLRLNQQFDPRFLANKHAFSQTTITASSFRRIWKGGILATRLHSHLTYGNTPWGLLPILGGSYTMRGYYEGRYRDKCEIDACIELRQHIWRRNGAVAWVGAGTVFSDFKTLKWRMVLPNYGIGYRWEFKKFMNVRLDLGFGRHQTGFIFSINEAF